MKNKDKPNRNFSVEAAVEPELIERMENLPTFDLITLRVDRAAAWLIVKSLLAQLEDENRRPRAEAAAAAAAGEPCRYVVAGLGGAVRELIEDSEARLQL